MVVFVSPFPPWPLEKNDESKFAKQEGFSRIGKKRLRETECHGLQPATTTVSASDSCPTAVIWYWSPDSTPGGALPPKANPKLMFPE